MKNARYTNAKRVQRREEREHRVQAGKILTGLDYRCPLCKGWFSTYRNRHGIHRAHCGKKRARQIVARSESDRAQTPLPPQNHLTPEPLASRSPTPVPLTTGGSEQREQILDNHIIDVVLQDVFHPPPDILSEVSMLDEEPALPAGDDGTGESDISWFFQAHVPHMCLNAG